MTPSRRSADSGFTLIEVLVALVLLASVALILVDLTCRAVSLTDRARRQAVMTAMAAERVEQLMGRDWGLGDATTAAPVTDTGTDLTRTPRAGGGAGLAVSPGDALTANVMGYSDFADRRGTWIGAGPTIPAGAAFVRRWRVARVPETRTCLVVEVVVDAVDSTGLRRGLSAAVVKLTTAKTRKAA